MKRLLSIRLTLLIALTFLMGCNTHDDPVNIEQTVQENATTVYQERISANDAPKLESLVSDRIGGKKVGITLKTDNLERLGEYQVNWDEVNVLTDTMGIKNYALRLETSNPDPLVFYNIVVTEDTDGNFLDPIIAEYVVDGAFYLEWRKHPEKMAEFTGSVYYYDMAGELFTKEGKTATLSARDGAPCPSITFGPSGPSAPYTPNIYCWSYVSYGLCETQIEYGTGTGYHGAGGCGAGTGSAIYGYGVTCSNDPGGRNTTKGYTTGKSPCGGGGSSLPGGVPINPVSPGAADIGSFVGFLDNKLQLTTAQENFLEYGPEVVLILELQLLLDAKKAHSKTKDYARAAISYVEGKKTQISRDNVTESIEALTVKIINNGQVDYADAIRRMASHLKKFGSLEDIIYAEYMESLISDFPSMSVGEVADIHGLIEDYIFDFQIRFWTEALTPVITDLVIPVITYALFEAAGNTAFKLLQKIPVSWVLRGSRLNEMVKRVGLLGEMGTSNTIRIVKTNAPITTSKELFNSLTKNAVSKSTTADGAIVGNMGNGNFITYRPVTASQSGFPATISLDFRAAGIWSQIRNVKFIAP